MPYVTSDFEYKDPKRYTFGCKHRKLDDIFRPSRNKRAERKYSKNPEHTGKGKTLRSHRKGLK